MKYDFKDIETLIDLTNLKDLVNNEHEMIKAFLIKFVNNAKPLVNEINVNFSNKNYKEIAKLAHQLKPIIDFFEISQIKKDIKLIEEICKSNKNSDDLKNLLENLNKVMSDIFNQINKLP